MEAARGPLEGPGPALTSLMECRSIAYDLQLAEEQRVIARKVAAQPWPQSALALRQMDTFASPRCTPEWLHRSWEGDSSLLAVAAEVEATAEAGRLFAPSQTQDGPKPLPVAGALPDLGVPVAGIGTMGMDKETAAVALARAAQACKGSSEGRAAWGQERVLERGSMESTEAVLLCSALLQSRAEAWRAGEGGREEQIRCTGDAAGEAGVKKGKGGRGQEPRMGGGRRGQEGPSMGPSAGAVDADAAEPLPGLPREVGDGEPAFRWLPPLDAKGGGRRNKKRPREGTGRKEKRPREGTGRADAGDQRGGRRKAGRAAVQDATRGSAGEGGREPNESSLPGPGRAPLPGPGSKLSFGRTGEGAEKWEGAEDWEGEQAWQEVRGVCDEGAVLAWRLVGQQLLRRAQKAGCQAPSLVAALQGPRTASSPSEAEQQAPESRRAALPLGGTRMGQQLSELLALAPHLTPRTREAIASRLGREVARKPREDFQVLHP